MSGILRSLKRREARARAQWMNSGVGYRAAEQNRLLKDWVWRHISADQEIFYDLLALRGRSRELVRNSAWGANYARIVRNNAIGPAGIRLQAQVEKADGTPNDVVNDGIEDSFAEWGEPETCTVDGRLGWLGVQALIGSGLPMDGEVLVRIVRGFDNPFGFALQMLDPDQLDHFLISPPSKNGNEVRSGVEIDRWNRPVAYHLWRGHPSDPNTASMGRERVLADEIIHVYDPYRVAQTRGVPWLAPVMLNINMLRGYHEAELVAARVAAAKGGFFVKELGDDGPGISPNETAAEMLALEAEPGVFEELPAGMKFEAWDPQHPNAAFNDFTRSMLRTIAAGGGVSASSLSKDLADVNYSSIRAGLIDERDEARRVQQLLVTQFHRKVFREWAKMARLYGALDARLAPSSAYRAVTWRPRGWAWVDPRNDAEAAIIRIQNGLDSRSRIVSEEGRDYEEVLEELALEQKLAKAKGVTITAAAKVTPSVPGQSDPVSDPAPGASTNSRGN